MFPIQRMVLWCFQFVFCDGVELRWGWEVVVLLYSVSVSLTFATVAILVELIAFCAIALVHPIVELIAELFARTPLTAPAWNDKGEEQEDGH